MIIGMAVWGTFYLTPVKIATLFKSSDGYRYSGKKRTEKQCFRSGLNSESIKPVDSDPESGSRDPQKLKN